MRVDSDKSPCEAYSVLAELGCLGGDVDPVQASRVFAQDLPLDLECQIDVVFLFQILPHPLHTAPTTATISAAVLRYAAVVRRLMRRIRGSGLTGGPLGAPGERQEDEERGKLSLPVHHYLDPGLMPGPKSTG
jgi:hypothetical protein